MVMDQNMYRKCQFLEPSVVDIDDRMTQYMSCLGQRGKLSEIRHLKLSLENSYYLNNIITMYLSIYSILIFHIISVLQLCVECLY